MAVCYMWLKCRLQPAAGAMLNSFIGNPPTASLEFVGFSFKKKKKPVRPLSDLPQFAEIPASGESRLHNICAVYR